MTYFTHDDVEQMIEEQKALYYSGVTKDISFRKSQLQKLKLSIKKYEKEVLHALKVDLNKSEFEAYANEVGFVLDSIQYMLKNIDEWAEPVPVKTPIQFQPAKSFIVHDPYGVVLIIGPFNYPFQLVMEPLIGAIIGGNTAIVKPSESSVETCKIVKKIIEETFESNYVRVVEGEKEEVTALIHAPFDYIFFTGSVAVGKIVMRAASERLTPITLELGGKSPAIVDHTANIDVAVKRIAWGKFNNNGQTCVAPDYCLVHASVYDEFVTKLKLVIKDFFGEDAMNSEDYGRIINDRQFNRLVSILQLEKQNISYGGKVDPKSRYIEPTIVEGVNWSSPVMEDEIFGPILPILTFEHLGKAFNEIRKKPKPLAAYFFSEHEKAIDYFLQELSFGGGCVNDTVIQCGNPYLPFGGVGPSGMNAYHGKASFDTFTHSKSIMKRSSKFSNNILFPPYKQKVKLVRKIIK
ncbi:aldehyde dehydrogenase (NAD+) [Lysinibacillus composti]|uniref:Aldehyde dehydrogenase n=1 Tax=Lysinibacillus composti TaxID=720633 RepID=A0A3N9UGW0_9BACI|nr:aldehyde dehydrogenase [Lysinibacillus composti]MBM7607887.1 aldehyde dehydrogenase (NAD+) [Lysinibacillus composti]RQW75354.1 aldehyde dehydrogenase [Lysinibacillus composti]